MEKKVELLEKAFEAIGNVNRSKELEETIEGYSRALKLVELLDSADNSTNKAFDVDAFQRKYEESVEEKRAIDRKIEIDKQIIAIQIHRRTKGDDAGEYRARRRTQAY